MIALKPGIHSFPGKVVVVLDEQDAREHYEMAATQYGEKDGYTKDLLEAIKLAFPVDFEADLLQ